MPRTLPDASFYPHPHTRLTIGNWFHTWFPIPHPESCFAVGKATKCCNLMQFEKGRPWKAKWFIRLLWLKASFPEWRCPGLPGILLRSCGIWEERKWLLAIELSFKELNSSNLNYRYKEWTRFFSIPLAPCSFESRLQKNQACWAVAFIWKWNPAWWHILDTPDLPDICDIPIYHGNLVLWTHLVCISDQILSFSHQTRCIQTHAYTQNQTFRPLLHSGSRVVDSVKWRSSGDINQWIAWNYSDSPYLEQGTSFRTWNICPSFTIFQGFI